MGLENGWPLKGAKPLSVEEEEKEKNGWRRNGTLPH